MKKSIITLSLILYSFSLCSMEGQSLLPYNFYIRSDEVADDEPFQEIYSNGSLILNSLLLQQAPDPDKDFVLLPASEKNVLAFTAIFDHYDVDDVTKKIMQDLKNYETFTTEHDYQSKLTALNEFLAITQHLQAAKFSALIQRSLNILKQQQSPQGEHGDRQEVNKHAQKRARISQEEEESITREGATQSGSEQTRPLSGPPPLVEDTDDENELLMSLLPSQTSHLTPLSASLEGLPSELIFSLVENILPQTDNYFLIFYFKYNRFSKKQDFLPEHLISSQERDYYLDLNKNRGKDLDSSWGVPPLLNSQDISKIYDWISQEPAFQQLKTSLLILNNFATTNRKFYYWFLENNDEVVKIILNKTNFITFNDRIIAILKETRGGGRTLRVNFHSLIKFWLQQFLKNNQLVPPFQSIIQKLLLKIDFIILFEKLIEGFSRHVYEAPFVEESFAQLKRHFNDRYINPDEVFLYNDDLATNSRILEFYLTIAPEVTFDQMIGIELLQMLLDKGANPNKLPGDQHSPLTYTVKRVLFSTAKELINRGATTDSLLYDTLSYFFPFKHLGRATQRVNFMRDILTLRNYDTSSLINPNDLMTHVTQGQSDLPLSFLIQLCFPMIKNAMNLIKEFDEYQKQRRKTSPDQYISFPPVRNLLLSALEELIKWGADPNKMDTQGRTPLEVLLRSFHEWLLDKQLYNSSYQKEIDLFYEQAIKLFLSYKARLNTQDDLGRTLLMRAIAGNETEFALLILKVANPDINLSDYEGNTPLMHAIIQSNNCVMKQLLSKSELDLGAKNKQGKTALDMAKNYLDDEHIKLLQEVIEKEKAKQEMAQ